MREGDPYDKQLRDLRQAYDEARKRAKQIAAAFPNTGIGRERAKEAKQLEAAINSVDVALKMKKAG
jgi:hypothetical protein